MPKPPLSRAVLRAINDLEAEANESLKACGDPSNFNHDKAIRNLRTFSVAWFDIQADYLVSLPNPVYEWLVETYVECLKVMTTLPELPEGWRNQLHADITFVVNDRLTEWKSRLAKTAQSGLTAPVVKAEETPAKQHRASAMISSPSAAKRMETFYSAMGPKEFAALAKTSEKTLRAFRRTGKIRRDKFARIAEAMAMTKEDLLMPDPETELRKGK